MTSIAPDAGELAGSTARRIDEARDGSRRRPVLVVACDGAHASTRPAGGRKTKRGPGVWREANGIRLYLLGKDVLAARIPRDRVRVALVGDGANWIWDVMLRHFPGGEEILDSYHCAEHVYETARAQFGDGTLEAQEWAEAALTRLCLNELGLTVGGLRRMQPRDAAAEESISTLIGYLHGQRERVGYDEL